MKRKMPAWKKFKQKPSERLKRGIYKLIAWYLQTYPVLRRKKRRTSKLKMNPRY